MLRSMCKAVTVAAGFAVIASVAMAGVPDPTKSSTDGTYMLGNARGGFVLGPSSTPSVPNIPPAVVDGYNVMHALPGDRDWPGREFKDRRRGFLERLSATLFAAGLLWKITMMPLNAGGTAVAFSPKVVTLPYFLDHFALGMSIAAVSVALGFGRGPTRGSWVPQRANAPSR